MICIRNISELRHEHGTEHWTRLDEPLLMLEVSIYADSLFEDGFRVVLLQQSRRGLKVMMRARVACLLIQTLGPVWQLGLQTRHIRQVKRFPLTPPEELRTDGPEQASQALINGSPCKLLTID
jgi:hypothetical protein